MNLKTILNALLDAAEARWPKWAGVFEMIRPLIAEHPPTDDGLVVVGAAPAGITKLIVDYLNGLADKVHGPFVKYALKAFVRVVPTLLDAIWESVFPGQPKPMMAAGEAPADFGSVAASVV